jgi:hypothetical protein
VNRYLLSAVLSLLFAAPVPAQSDDSAIKSSTEWQLPDAVRTINQVKSQQFIAFDPHYEKARAERVARLRGLAKQFFAREAATQDVRCAHGIYNELLWLISSTADFKRMDERLNDLKVALASTEPRSTSGDNSDCLSEWFFRLDWTYDHLQSDQPIPTELIEKINSPDKLTAYLTSVSASDIPLTGRDNWLEFNLSMADLLRWLLRDRPDDKAFDPALKQTFRDLIFRFQDPQTGCWGQRYSIDGQQQFVPDLSTTFHIVSYLEGKVPYLDRIAMTTLATKDLDSPVSWLYKGQQYNHNCMDVVEIFNWEWPAASAEQRQAMAAGIHEMLRRCLAESLQSDGSFKHIEADQSIEEATYFGASFLSRIGFFSKSKRFWTDQDFPEAEGIRLKIIDFIEKHHASGATGGGFYDSLLEQLQQDAPNNVK